MLNKSKRLEAYQAWLCFALLVGLVAYLAISLWLRATGLVGNPQNLQDMDRVALQLFIPYLGVAIGGLFGTAQLHNAEPDRFRFMVAVVTIVVWDLLIVVYMLLVLFKNQMVEDFIQFANGTLSVISTLMAAILAYYFGAQSGHPATISATGEAKP